MHGSLLPPKQRRVEQPENHPEMKREIIRAQPSNLEFQNVPGPFRRCTDSAPEHCLKKANGFHASSIHEMREYCLDAFFPQDFQHVKVSCLCSFGGPVSNDSDSFVLSVMMVVFND